MREGAEGRAQGPYRHPRLMHRLGVGPHPDAGFVGQELGDRGAQRTLHQVAGGGLPGQRRRYNLGRSRSRRADRSDELWHLVGGGGPCGEQPLPDRPQECVVASFGQLHLDLAKACRHPPSVEDRHLFVDYLGQRPAVLVCQDHPMPKGGKVRDRLQHRVPEIGPDELEGHRWGCLGCATELQLVAVHHRPVGAARQLHRPALVGAIAEVDAPAGEAQVGSVVVGGLHPPRVARPCLDAGLDSGQVGEMEPGACGKLQLALDRGQSLRRALGIQPQIR